MAPAHRQTNQAPAVPGLPTDSQQLPEQIPPPKEPILSNIMMAIQDCKASLSTQIASMHMDFSLLKQDVQNLRDRTGATEEQISTLEDTVHPLSITMHDTTSEMAAFHAKIDDLENGSCRKNLRFVGFPGACRGR